jgi:tetratricopeptide (TPR) repeat protein
MRDRWDRLASGLLEAGWLGCVVGVPLALSRVLSLTFTADKVLLFRCLTEVMALVALLVWLRRPRLRAEPLTLALGAYAVVLTLATLFGRNISQGFWGSYLRLFGLFTLLHGGVLYLVVSTHLRTDRQWRRLLGAVAVVSVLVCTHAILQWRGLEGPVLSRLLGQPDFHWDTIASESYRPFATLGNSSYLGTFLVFATAFGLGTLFTLPQRCRWPAGLLLAVLALVLALNQTRGAWIAVAAVGLTFALLTARRERRRAIATACGGVAVAVLLTGIVCARFPNAPWVTANAVLTRLAHFVQHDRNSSGWYRLDMWRRVASDAAASPGSLLLGYGPESYLLVASRSFVPAYADGAEGAQFMDSTHNILGDALVDGGLLGLAALVTVLFLGFRTGVRGLRSAGTPAQRVVLCTALAALVGYVVQGMFLFNHVVTLVYLSVTLGLIAAASRRDWGVEREEDRVGVGVGVGVGVRGLAAGLRPGSIVLAAVVVAFVGLVLLPANGRVYQAQALKRRADELTAAGRIGEATTALREACRLVPYERTYRVALATSIAAGAPPVGSDPAALQEAFRGAERELRRAIAMDPGDVRTYWPLGLLYQFWGPVDREKFAEGEAVYRQAAALSPRRQRTYWAWGDLKLTEGKRDDAVALYRRALELDPSVLASQRALAQLYVRLGQPEDAEPLFADAWRRSVMLPAEVGRQAVEREALGLAFLARGRTERARVHLSGALSLNPGLGRAREAMEQLSRQQAVVPRRETPRTRDRAG